MSDYPWTDSQALVDQLALEMLAKRGWGDPVLLISLPISWIDEFDILSNFRFQNPFGLSTTGGGEQARYYYIISEAYDFLGEKIDIIAVDLQFLLTAYFVKGDENLLASNWATAGQADRMFAYKCDETTGKFDDGELGKILVDENLLP
jgi:hypothetical protein